MRVLLNITKRNNFVFFDPVNKVHMSRISPMAEVKELSPSIKRAILSGSLIDIDNSFGLKISSEMESLNEKVLKALNVERKIKEEKVVEPLIEKEVIEAVTTEEATKEEAVVEEKAVEKPAPKKRTRKAVK